MTHSELRTKCETENNLNPGNSHTHERDAVWEFVLGHSDMTMTPDQVSELHSEALTLCLKFKGEW